VKPWPEGTKYLLGKCPDLRTERRYAGKATQVGNAVVLHRSRPEEEEKQG
jgi:hypothetical protein